MIAAINLNLIILEAQIICDHTRLGPLSSFAWVGLVLDGHRVTNLVHASVHVHLEKNCGCFPFTRMLKSSYI